jgi:hypothetical protein
MIGESSVVGWVEFLRDPTFRAAPFMLGLAHSPSQTGVNALMCALDPTYN